MTISRFKFPSRPILLKRSARRQQSAGSIQRNLCLEVRTKREGFLQYLQEIYQRWPSMLDCRASGWHTTKVLLRVTKQQSYSSYFPSITLSPQSFFFALVKRQLTVCYSAKASVIGSPIALMQSVLPTVQTIDIH